MESNHYEMKLHFQRLSFCYKLANCVDGWRMGGFHVSFFKAQKFIVVLIMEYFFLPCLRIH